MHKEQVKGLIRHILTIAGGYAVGRGYVDQSTALELVGAMSSFIGIIWSLATKDKQINHGYKPF